MSAENGPENVPTVPTHHVFLLDGTKHSLLSPKKSHIYRLNIGLINNKNLSSSNPGRCKQITYYAPGIGAEPGLKHQADSAIAFTFDSRVVRTLKLIVNEWNEGDYITLIGYSRGAAAAMVLARYIKLMGIPSRGDEEDELPKQVKLLIRKHGDTNCSDFAEIKGRRDRERRDVLVTRLILFDPVATTLFSLRKDNVIFESSDARQVICCYSADESRALFPPTQHVPSRHSHQEDHAQFAIFCGDHSDIGGASGSSLCYIPLRYAIIKAHTEEPRLRFRRDFLIDHFLDPHHLQIERKSPLLSNNEVDYDRCRGEDPCFLRRADQLDSKCNITKPRDLKWKMLPMQHRNFERQGQVQVHWTVGHRENVKDVKYGYILKAKVQNPRRYTA